MTRTAVTARILPFTDDRLLELLEDGKDIESIADAWEYAALKRKHAYLDAIEFADTHPVQPVSERTKVLATAERQQARIGHCPSSAIFGWDTNGHNYAKELYCGLEYCPDCGQKDSVPHKRRFARWLPKVQTLKSAGYFVIEFPLSIRHLYHSKAALERAGKLATHVLKGDYEIKQRRTSGEVLHKGEVGRVHRRWFAQGLRRWHYFGDAPANVRVAVERQQGITQLPLDTEFATMRYNPHLNVIVSAGFIPDARLDYIKAMLRAAFNCSDLIVNYSFADVPGKIVHLLKYVTRATFLDINWDKYLAGSLYGFRNMRGWGKWTGEAVWTLDDLGDAAHKEVEGVDIEAVNSLGESRCPLDGLPIHWSKPMPMGLLHYLIKTQGDDVKVLGAGYYRLKDTYHDDTYDGETMQMRYERLLNTALARVRTDERCELLSRHDRHELSLAKTQSGQNEGVLADCSGSVSQKAIQTDKTSAGIRQTNLFDSVVSRSPIKACRIPASLNSCSGWAVVELPTHHRVGMVEVCDDS